MIRVSTIFLEVRRFRGGELDVDEEGSEPGGSNPCNHYATAPMVIDRMTRAINLAKKVIVPAMQPKEHQQERGITQSRLILCTRVGVSQTDTRQTVHDKILLSKTQTLTCAAATIYIEFRSINKA